jgi:hypothetical protein
MSFFQKLFAKFHINRSLKAAEKSIDSKPDDELFTPIQKPFGGEDVETVDEHSVTNIYSVMRKHMDSAIESSQESGAAAARVTDAIGGPPVPPKKEK